MNEEAIEYLNTMLLALYVSDGNQIPLGNNNEVKTAIQMAIKAMQTELLEVEAAKEQKAYNEGFNACKRIMAREKQFNSYCPNCMGKLEPCEDAISRKSVIDVIYANAVCENEYNLTSSRIKKAVEELPSVNPQIIRCKDCKHRDPEDKKCDCGCWHFPFVTKDDDFCSYAEAKMKEGE